MRVPCKEFSCTGCGTARIRLPIDTDPSGLVCSACHEDGKRAVAEHLARYELMRNIGAGRFGAGVANDPRRIMDGACARQSSVFVTGTALAGSTAAGPPSAIRFIDEVPGSFTPFFEAAADLALQRAREAFAKVGWEWPFPDRTMRRRP